MLMHHPVVLGMMSEHEFKFEGLTDARNAVIFKKDYLRIVFRMGGKSDVLLHDQF